MNSTLPPVVIEAERIQSKLQALGIVVFVFVMAQGSVMLCALIWALQKMLLRRWGLW